MKYTHTAFTVGLSCLVLLGHAVPAFADESSSFVLYPTFPNDAAGIAAGSTNFQTQDAGLTWRQLPATSGSFQLQAATLVTSSSSSASVTSSSSPASEPPPPSGGGRGSTRDTPVPQKTPPSVPRPPVPSAPATPAHPAAGPGKVTRPKTTLRQRIRDRRLNRLARHPAAPLPAPPTWMSPGKYFQERLHLIPRDMSDASGYAACLLSSDFSGALWCVGGDAFSALRLSASLLPGTSNTSATLWTFALPVFIAWLLMLRRVERRRTLSDTRGTKSRSRARN